VLVRVDDCDACDAPDDAADPELEELCWLTVAVCVTVVGV
jgi:hypothetical protein